MSRRACAARNAGGEPCRQAPLRDGLYCFWHDPENEEAAKEARRAGRARQRREGTITAAFVIEGVENVDDLRRLLMIAVTDCLQLNNDLGRVRALGQLVQVGLRLRETGELEGRVEALEAALEPRIHAINASQASQGRRR